MEGTPFSSMEEQPTSKPREPTTRILAFSLQPKSPSRAEPSVQTMKKSSMKEHHQLLPQAHQILASYTRVENVSNEVKEQAEALILMHKESSTGRERLKRHREEWSGKEHHSHEDKIQKVGLQRCYPPVKIINHKWVQSLSQWGKNHLMRFFKLVQRHLVATVGVGTSDNDEEKGNTKISDEDLEMPFVDYL
ncbi:hypothetical protein D5086_018886 [Populus alba]|uniref:Uncharacterized protein n=1 Tax=Populus alba TaxID=43335 RepID=A0ACC4BRL1_POPAL